MIPIPMGNPYWTAIGQFDVQIRSWDRLAQSMKRLLPTTNKTAVYFP
jgi:hypothetical protein